MTCPAIDQNHHWSSFNFLLQLDSLGLGHTSSRKNGKFICWHSWSKCSFRFFTKYSPSSFDLSSIMSPNSSSSTKMITLKIFSGQQCPGLEAHLQWKNLPSSVLCTYMHMAGFLFLGFSVPWFHSLHSWSLWMPSVPMLVVLPLNKLLRLIWAQFFSNNTLVRNFFIWIYSYHLNLDGIIYRRQRKKDKKKNIIYASLCKYFMLYGHVLRFSGQVVRFS